MQRKPFLSIDDILDIKQEERQLKREHPSQRDTHHLKHYSKKDTRPNCSFGRPTFVPCRSMCCCARGPQCYRSTPYSHQYYVNYGNYASQLYFRSHYSKQPKKRMRASFSHEQVLSLQKVFDTKKYLGNCERKELARELRMTEQQIKIWFQNRRYKAKKQQKMQTQDDDVIGSSLGDSQGRADISKVIENLYDSENEDYLEMI